MKGLNIESKKYISREQYSNLYNEINNIKKLPNNFNGTNIFIAVNDTDFFVDINDLNNILSNYDLKI